MKIRFKKNVGNDFFSLIANIKFGEEKIELSIAVTDYSVYAIYRDGYFEIMGTMLLGDKSFDKIKCPKKEIWKVEEYINCKL